MHIFKKWKQEKLTLIMEGGSYNNKKGDWEIEGVILDSKPDTFYSLSYRNENIEIVKDKDYVSLHNYSRQLFKELVAKELKQFIDKNMTNKSFYTEGDFFNRLTFTDKEISNYWDQSDCSELHEGKAIYNNIIHFDLETETIMIIDNKIIKEALRYTYSQHELNQFVAKAQFEAGKGNKTYIEFQRFNAWLAGKQSFNMVLKDGTVLNYKNKYSSDITVTNLISARDNRLVFQTCYQWQNQPNTIDLKDIKYFQFSKSIFTFDNDNLILKGA